VTTDLVIAELLNFFALRGAVLRQLASDLYLQEIAVAETWTLARLTPEAFDAAAAQYPTARTSRQNAPGLVDLHSMNVVREAGITVAWTFDPAFAHAGFETPLIPKSELPRPPRPSRPTNRR
jgi:hypothetical protein